MNDSEPDLARPLYREQSHSFIDMHDEHEQIQPGDDLEQLRNDRSMVPRLEVDGSHPVDVVVPQTAQDVDRQDRERARASDNVHTQELYSDSRARADLPSNLKYLDLASKSAESLDRDEQDALQTLIQQGFNLTEAEQLVAAHPAWLLKSVMIQGYLFVMKSFLCFYAYMPRHDDITVKSGSLVKRSRTSNRQHRHWFILKNDVLSYYEQPDALYFPSGSIDLRYAERVVPDVENSGDGYFGMKLVTSHRTYYLRADTASAVSEWVKIIQKVIFRLKNQGDCVKIKIPLACITDVEESDIVEFARTLKVKAADDDETYAVNEYLFPLFSNASDIIAQVKSQLQGRAPSTSAVSNISDTSRDAPIYERPKIYEQLATQMKDGEAPNIETYATALVEQHKKEEGILPSLPILHSGHADDDDFDDVQSTAPEGSALNLPAIGSRIKTVAKTAGHVVTGGVFASKDEPMGEADQQANETYRLKFGLRDDTRLLRTFQAFYMKVLPSPGELSIGENHICYDAHTPAYKVRVKLPLEDIETVKKEKGFKFAFSGIVINIRAHEPMFFEFSSSSERDRCLDFIEGARDNLENVKERQRPKIEEIAKQQKLAKEEHDAIENAFKKAGYKHDQASPPLENVVDVPGLVFDTPNASMVAFKPAKQLRFTCLTIGSRGDVQPYVALCKGLIADGQKAKIATHEEFRDFVESHGIEFEPIDGNPAELMAICVEHGMFTYSFLKEATSKFRGWIDDLLKSSWKACQNTDVLIESPSAMGGIHIAEALGIPYFRAFTMPWSKTRVYPQAFAVPSSEKGGAYNTFTYSAFDTLFWKGISGQVNRWRKKSLNLSSTSFDKLAQHKVPFLYNFSPSVVPPAMDWPEWIKVTGYWFLEGSDDKDNKKWEAPQDVADFIKKARSDKKKLVYIGFGSIVVSDPKALTKAVVEAVKKSGVRCILSKGWSDRGSKKDDDDEEEDERTEKEKEEEKRKQKEEENKEFGDSILSVDSIPHDWLFPQLDCACHHGGAGSLGASLRAGIPTIVKPFFGDQYFFGGRVQDLGVGQCLKKLTAKSLSEALKFCTTDELTIQKADKIGEQIRSERGVDNAIENIYRDMEYARSLIKDPSRAQPGSADSDGSYQMVEHDDGDSEEDDDELFEKSTDDTGKVVTSLRKLKDLRLPNPLGDRSGSYGLSSIKAFKQKASNFKLSRH
ncbi:hypothetical protein BCR37DRAFT_267731 [Protomyces lactucae-debilis]|uniref:sterol 3beta-glucosyltransferase n=1 Tax=Protomyces lactucae-debilis TaxID=2754530 RepID=A0A1Y2FKL0_PROLT|nr:uncharacterized protein BCR37DRAFT_267731 [Protomyces lactucae-debilis]ORY84459.1 hypothetical protein BCR37DRAFT_267731 [Protomyces lactucae-debilis]